LKNGLYNGALYENRDSNKASSWKKARSPLPTPRVRVDICGPHQDIRRHVSSEEGKARVLTKAQQVIVDLWDRDDAKLVNILHNIMGLGSHKGVDKFRCANGHANAGHARDIDNAKLRFSKVHFTETLERRVLIDVPEHKLEGSFSDDTWDVNF
jgi:hypothetical protein